MSKKRAWILGVCDENIIIEPSIFGNFGNEDYSLVSVLLETGRKNQIRVCFQSLKHPIVGDKKYGIRDNGSRLYLHANRLKMYYPVIKKDILFETANPQEFKKIMN